MPLQSTASTTNPLCLSEVRTELGISSSTRLCLNDSSVRSLAGKPSSGTICLSDLLGKGVAPAGLPSGTTFISSRIETSTWQHCPDRYYGEGFSPILKAVLTFNDNGSVSATNSSTGLGYTYPASTVTTYSPILSSGQSAATKYIGGSLASGTRANYQISYTNMQWETINYSGGEMLAWVDYGNQSPFFRDWGNTWGNYLGSSWATNPANWNGFTYPPVGYRTVSGGRLSFWQNYPGYYKGPLPSTSYLSLSSYPTITLSMELINDIGNVAVRVTGTVNLRTGSTTFSYPLHLVCYAWTAKVFLLSYYTTRGFAKGAFSPFPGYKTSQTYFFHDR